MAKLRQDIVRLRHLLVHTFHHPFPGTSSLTTAVSAGVREGVPAKKKVISVRQQKQYARTLRQYEQARYLFVRELAHVEHFVRRSPRHMRMLQGPPSRSGSTNPPDATKSGAGNTSTVSHPANDALDDQVMFVRRVHRTLGHYLASVIVAQVQLQMLQRPQQPTPTTTTAAAAAAAGANPSGGLVEVGQAMLQMIRRHRASQRNNIGSVLDDQQVHTGNIQSEAPPLLHHLQPQRTYASQITNTSSNTPSNTSSNTTSASTTEAETTALDIAFGALSPADFLHCVRDWTFDGALVRLHNPPVHSHQNHGSAGARNSARADGDVRSKGGRIAEDVYAHQDDEDQDGEETKDINRRGPMTTVPTHPTGNGDGADAQGVAESPSDRKRRVLQGIRRLSTAVQLGEIPHSVALGHST